MKPPEVRALLLFNRQMSYSTRSCPYVAIETNAVFPQHLPRRRVSVSAGGTKRGAGPTMGSPRAAGCFAVGWVLPFIVSALSLTVHCNVLNGRISPGSRALPRECAPASLKRCLSRAWQHLSMEHLWTLNAWES